MFNNPMMAEMLRNAIETALKEGGRSIVEDVAEKLPIAALRKLIEVLKRVYDKRASTIEVG